MASEKEGLSIEERAVVERVRDGRAAGYNDIGGQAVDCLLAIIDGLTGGEDREHALAADCWCGPVVEVVGQSSPETSREGRRRAVASDGEQKHVWLMPGEAPNFSRWTCCLNCGAVKRADGTESACRGRVHVELRTAVPEEPTDE